MVARIYSKITVVNFICLNNPLSLSLLAVSIAIIHITYIHVYYYSKQYIYLCHLYYSVILYGLFFNQYVNNVFIASSALEHTSL